jgi:hypothetical protein
LRTARVRRATSRSSSVASTGTDLRSR